MSTSTLVRPVMTPITDSLVAIESARRMVCSFCGEPVDLVCEQYDVNDACICEDCQRAGKGAWMEVCPCPACTALIEEVRAHAH